jgi:hypothetical protein
MWCDSDNGRFDLDARRAQIEVLKIVSSKKKKLHANVREMCN